MSLDELLKALLMCQWILKMQVWSPEAKNKKPGVPAEVHIRQVVQQHWRDVDVDGDDDESRLRRVVASPENGPDSTPGLRVVESDANDRDFDVRRRLQLQDLLLVNPGVVVVSAGDVIVQQDNQVAEIWLRQWRHQLEASLDGPVAVRL